MSIVLEAAYRDEADIWKNYSLQREVLEKVIEFLRTAGGVVSFY